VRRSQDTGSPSSTIASGSGSELPGDAFRWSAEESEANERNRPGPLALPDYARFLKQFHWTREQLRAIPLHTGVPPFTLD
jgi:hypothetical protein